MKVLAISDLHIDASSLPGGSFRDPARVRDMNIELCVNEIFPAIDKVIADEGIDMVVTTGDVFDSSRPTLKAIAAIRSWVSSLDIPSVHITGNHELIGLSRYDDNILEYALGDIELATVVSKPTIIHGMAMIPWPTTRDWDSYYDHAPAADVMFGHVELSDVVDYSSKGVSSKIIADKWPVAILGHYHHRTLTPKNTVGYVGSAKPPRVTSGEVEHPPIGVAIVDNGKVSIVDIETSRRCVKINASDIDDSFVSDASSGDAIIVIGQSDRISELRKSGALVGTILAPTEGGEGDGRDRAPASTALKSPIDYVVSAVEGDDDADAVIDFFTDFFSTN